jgi:hypothetical protein
MKNVLRLDDYELGEARVAAEMYIDGIINGFYRGANDYQAALIHERKHWEKMLETPEALRDFVIEFNRITSPVCEKAFGYRVYL